MPKIATRSKAAVNLFFTQRSDKSSWRARSAFAVAESPDTFRSRPESKKPFQLHLRTELAEYSSNWYARSYTRPSGTRDAREHAATALCELIHARRARISECVSVNVCACDREGISLGPPKRDREAASYMIHSLYKNNRLL